MQRKKLAGNNVAGGGGGAFFPVLHWLVVLALVGGLALSLAGCAKASGDADSVRPTTTLAADFHDADLGCGWEPAGSMDLRYARCFTVDYYAGGYALVCVADGNRYLVVPDGQDVPEGLDGDIQVLRQPIGDIYLAASDTMCLFDALGQVDRIAVSGIQRDDWSVQAARDAMDAGRMVYGGKYRSPDYELLVSQGVQLAVESTMINHTPDVREKLMEMGVPVLVELSSYEGEPLGRAEWIRLYGMLCGEDELAKDVFVRQEERAKSAGGESTGKTVAFFYLNANGVAVVRRPGDYVAKIVEQAGGVYAFDDLEAAKPGSGSVTMEMERFYATAKDADVIVYNATVGDSVASLDELVQKNGLLADFAAVRAGNVWLCDQNMYQQMVATGDVIADLNRVLAEGAEKTAFFRKLA